MNHSVTHITTAHQRYDNRIFTKMCSSLAINDKYSVSLIVCDELVKKEVKSNVSIHNIGKITGRVKRAILGSVRVFNLSRSLNSDIYHIHDPELLLAGLALKLTGRKVIYDAHEDLSEQVKNKDYLSTFVKKTISKSIVIFERVFFRYFDAIIGATEYISNKYKPYNSCSVNVNNYPIIDSYLSRKFEGIRRDSVCYVGAISEARGIIEFVKVAETLPNIRFILAGEFTNRKLKDKVTSMPGWSNIDYRGWCDREEVLDIYESSFAGLVTLHPISNYVDALPVKLFEYMASNIPVICSNIPLWENIVLKSNSGLSVDPYSVQDISKAITDLFNDSDLVTTMGSNGKKAVISNYSWEVESEKLTSLYELLLNK
ncbi:hypothetical protein BCT78_04615 [Vibrio breoganii]|uniref:glycosyltransferase n=1 Tax=Vibrio breoganii TaxID=553239 RepID=UPI000C840C53|nr:glycosyltransferase [Vibrio breoganii]PML38974.1 hypothetical protein BCT78_04615 [Vibrio breoganii]